MRTLRGMIKKKTMFCGVENAVFINSLRKDKFFSEICSFSVVQRWKKDDFYTMLQAMLLLDNRIQRYEYNSLAVGEVMRYASYINENYSEKQKEHLYDIIDYLEKAFPVRKKMLNKRNIPIVMLCADIAMGTEYNGIGNVYCVDTKAFGQWFDYFFTECYGEYKPYCMGRYVKKEKVIKRIEVMEKSLKNHFTL